MPQRIGFLWEKMIELDNCVMAERVMARNKPDNRMARYIGDHADAFGKILQQKLIDGYRFHKPYAARIQDSYKGKTRNLLIPCLEDQAAMQAWLNIATPYIERRNYYYNCGSIPKAGQSRAVNGLKRQLKGKRAPKWAAVTDIKKFYENCPHEAVINGLRKMFKDKRFIEFAKEILRSMSDTGVGLAIGFPVSHWFANVALMALDHDLCRRFPDVRHYRYMDDAPFVSRNKRHLRRALRFYMDGIRTLGMSIKKNWQVFPIHVRGITFLSYRFFRGYTILVKKLMFRIARKIRSAAKHFTPHAAMSVMSYLGILKHCNSHNFFITRVLPYVKPRKCRKEISNYGKSILLAAA